MNAEPVAPAHEHLVQFYGDDRARLERNARRFLDESLEAGGAALIAADESMRTALAGELRSDRVITLDANQTLAQLVGSDALPDAKRFEAIVAEPVRALDARYGRVNAYGEMVGILWSARAYAGAIALEAMWNELMESVELDLFCGYPIDVLGEDFQMGCVRPLLAAHTRVVPAVGHGFDHAMRRAMDEVLGDRGRGLRPIATQNFGAMATHVAPVEQTILRLRSTLPRYADEILALAQDYYRA